MLFLLVLLTLLPPLLIFLATGGMINSEFFLTTVGVANTFVAAGIMFFAVNFFMWTVRLKVKA